MGKYISEKDVEKFVIDSISEENDCVIVNREMVESFINLPDNDVNIEKIQGE